MDSKSLGFEDLQGVVWKRVVGEPVKVDGD
jgi:hypothetical protein